MLPGIDVSHFNGDIAHVLTQVDYAIAQATVGTLTDAAYKNDLAEMHAAKVRIGAYHYGVYGPGPTRQAQKFLSVAGDAQFLAVDAETRGSNRLLDHPATITSLIVNIRRLDPHKRRILLYSSDATTVLVGGRQISIWEAITAQDANWVASYTIHAPMHKWKFWQYSGTGVDKDRYNGSLADLDAWIAGKAA